MAKQRIGNFFEDFSPGMRFEHPTPRTLEQADQSLYIGLTGSRSVANSAATASERLGYARRPLEDLLVFNIAFGKTVPDISQNGVANLGYAEVVFHEPVFAGDTLTVSSEVIGLKQVSSGRAGVVYVRSAALNQHGSCVLSWIRWVLVHKRSPDAAAPPARVPELQSAVGEAALTALRWPERAGRITELTRVGDLWEDYAVGERIDHPAGMTLNDSDHSIATRLYQNTARAHFDAAMMSRRPEGKRLVYGGHVISVCKSLSYDGLENVLGWAAINGGRHVAPSFAGDTLRCATLVIGKIDSGHRHVGALRLRTVAAKNVADAAEIRFADEHAGASGPATTVLDIDYTVAIPRRSARPAASEHPHAS